MTMDWRTIPRDIGNAIYDAFVSPGDFVLSWLTAHAPSLATRLGVEGDDSSALLQAVVSLLLWILLALVMWMLVRLGQNLARTVSAIFRTLTYRISESIRSLKTRLVCKIRQLVPRRRSLNTEPVPELEFDDLDLAVLRNAAALGPGFTVSAPELAERLTLRPAQIQRSLDRLRSTKMLDYVIGSTDGFDNYRLTDYGSAFMAMLQRQAGQTGRA